ncbi:MAG: hypothetical protein J6Z45_02560 [Oscillospiraceae bacterium]|nr:hypothetical protein [Oscillospiraceae bacterium]
MNALTMLKAMSRLDPQEIADAWDGGETLPDAEAFPAEPEPAVRPVRHRLRRAAEFAAAAACVALGVTAVLRFRAYTDRPPLNSAPDLTAAVTLDTTETTASETALTSQTTLSQTETPTDTARNDASETQQTSDTESKTASETESTAADSISETEQQQTEPQKQTNTAPVPLLAAMGDDAGQLTKNGSACKEGEAVWSVVKDKAAIEAYLAGSAPEVILGTGKKPAGTVSAIRSDPAMIRVRWQSEDNRWESYGVRSAVIRNGVLYLGISVYCPDADGEYGHSPWIYEAGLLCEAGVLPDLRDVEITVTQFSDSAESGIREWMQYNDTLDPDIYMTFQNEEG